MISAEGVDGIERTYQCDGKKDHVQINWALGHGGRVHLPGPFNYDIGDSLLPGSNTTLEGEEGAILKLAKSLPVWGGPKVPISREKAMIMVAGNSAKNITLRNFTVDGSQNDFYKKIKLGTSCYNMATLIGCSGLVIQGVTWQNGCNDAILFNKCSGVLIDNIDVNKCGHDGIYAYNSKDVTVKNSRFINRTNSSCRFYNITKGVFSNNDCTTSGDGFAGLELEGAVKDIDIYNNYFHDLAGPAIARVRTKEINVKNWNNRIVNCG